MWEKAGKLISRINWEKTYFFILQNWDHWFRLWRARFPPEAAGAIEEGFKEAVLKSGKTVAEESTELAAAAVEATAEAVLATGASQEALRHGVKTAAQLVLEGVDLEDAVEAGVDSAREVGASAVGIVADAAAGANSTIPGTTQWEMLNSWRVLAGLGIVVVVGYVAYRAYTNTQLANYVAGQGDDADDESEQGGDESEQGGDESEQGGDESEQDGDESAENKKRRHEPSART